MRHHKLIYSSSYDRSLDVLLSLWPQVREKYPDATLDICYGWGVFDTIAGHNPERREWKRNVEILMKLPGVTHHGKLGKRDLLNLYKQVGIWAYPTYFTEIFCITALEAQSQGVVPVTMRYASLPEVSGSGVLIDGDVHDIKTRQLYLKELLALMGDEERWRRESQKAIKFAKAFSWERTAKLWSDEFRKDV